MHKLNKNVTMSSASIPTIRRLPSYLYLVRKAKEEGIEIISGTVIANELDLEPIQVRKDLASTGIIGKPRVGYKVTDLIDAIEKFLNWDKKHNAILVGAGNLGSALLGYKEFTKNGLNFLAAFDVDEKKIGTSINGTKVHNISELEAFVRNEDVQIAVLTVRSGIAQDVADLISEAGIQTIWNFTKVKLKVPKDVLLLKEDLSSSYAVLSVYS
ncbi:redox-sensing transcriptional repressor Rex [Spirochaeta isovalerica]|uniref:Redox-sensing transcriptional repressor Rex n=1 Tax=Spirochaeta isovalerica TaxID=150 RepID=A0A841R6P8_9SPIO|nr:redox-sensing transcriptional repressor Rex [Spirochaeta isovalerica]MBB6479061.1 redox-sensing transcriptional repressor [Spirochaeta isovalerica]